MVFSHPCLQQLGNWTLESFPDDFKVRSDRRLDFATVPTVGNRESGRCQAVETSHFEKTTYFCLLCTCVLLPGLLPSFSSILR
jgi:hypothetical protein